MDIIIGLTNLPQILITWSVYLGAGALFLAAGFWLNRRTFSTKTFLAGRFPFNLRSSRSVRLDVKVYVIGKLTGVFWAAPGTFLSAFLPIAALGVFPGVAATHEAGAFGIAVAGFVLFMTIELADFVTHYCEHKIPVLWELHKVHHSADSLNPLTSLRGHPFSMAMAGTVRALFFCVPAAAMMHFAGLSLVEIVAARVLIVKTCTVLTLDPLRHSPFPVSFGPLDRLFISPHMHQIHHSSLQPHLDKNFGTNLSLYDWLFRTGYKPVRNEPIRLGLYGYSHAELAGCHTIYGTYVTPAVKAWAKMRPARTVTQTPSSGLCADTVATVGSSGRPR